MNFGLPLDAPPPMHAFTTLHQTICIHCFYINKPHHLKTLLSTLHVIFNLTPVLLCIISFLILCLLITPAIPLKHFISKTPLYRHYLRTNLLFWPSPYLHCTSSPAFHDTQSIFPQIIRVNIHLHHLTALSSFLSIIDTLPQ